MKVFFIILAVAVVIATIVTALVSFKNTGKTVANFEECVRANYEVFDTYPKQCQTPGGDIFTEVIGTDETEPELTDTTQNPNEAPACVNFCGNGSCNQVVDCQGGQCSCREDSTLCPQDCPSNPTPNPTVSSTPTPVDISPFKTFENSKIKFDYPKEWQLEDKSKTETYGLEIVIKTNIEGVKEIKIIQEDEDIKNVRSDDIVREDPYVISNKNGFRWRVDGKEGKRYEYFTSGPNLDGTLGLRIKVDNFAKTTEERLNGFVDSITIKNK